jgi:hypothetical protein
VSRVPISSETRITSFVAPPEVIPVSKPVDLSHLKSLEDSSSW